MPSREAKRHVRASSVAAADYRARIFTIASELPFAGAVVGRAWASSHK